MIIELKDKDGNVIITVFSELEDGNVKVYDRYHDSVYREHLEKFALELTRALGHDWDKTIR